MMKAISVPQPLAWLVVRNHKHLDDRSWKTAHRGAIFIHANAQKVDPRDYAKFVEYCRSVKISPFPSINDFEYGGIIGAADLIGCEPAPEAHGMRYERRYRFLLGRARRLNFIPVSGHPKIWTLDVSVNVT